MDDKAICYDLTHSLGNFLQDGDLINELNSTKKEVIAGDFIISRLRSYLKEFAVVPKNIEKQIVSSEYLVYRPINNEVSSNTLLAFCLTRDVQNILKLSQYGTEHPRFYDFVFNELPIPIKIVENNSLINQCVQKSQNYIQKSKELYQEASNIMLEYLRSNDCEPKHSIEYTIKNLESIINLNRLDSEYFQQKYSDIENNLSKFKSQEIDKNATLKNNNFIPNKNERYIYIELANIGANGYIAGCEEYYGSELPTRARRLINKGDVLVSSIEGSLQSCAIVTEKFDRAVSSMRFYVLSPKKEMITSECLMVLLKSYPIQSLLKKGCSGTILTAITKDEFMKIRIPGIDDKVSKLITEKIKRSFKLRSMAYQSLNNTVREIEKILS